MAPCLYAQERETVSFADRWSLKTNAFEWLVTVPNIGVECDVVRTEFKKMSLNLTAKYNWNTYHKLAPATVFDMFDVRPEFRYYFRTSNRKLSRPWWPMYIGPYLSYGTYSFKIAPKGIRGFAAGAGVSAGYVIPIHEYRRGAVDMELGFSIGMQVCTRDVSTHNPQGHYYVKSEGESKGLHVTPFPVVSELRAAFAWRRESIRHQVKIDVDKRQRKEEYRKYLDLMQDDILVNMPESMAHEYGSREEFEKALQEVTAYLKGENAIRNSMYSFNRRHVKMLDRQVDARSRQLRRMLGQKEEDR